MTSIELKQTPENPGRSFFDSATFSDYLGSDRVISRVTLPLPDVAYPAGRAEWQPHSWAGLLGRIDNWVKLG